MSFFITFKELEATLAFHDKDWEIVLKSDKNYSKTKGLIENVSKSYCISLNHVQAFFEYEVSDTITFTFVIENGQDVLTHKGNLSRKSAEPVSEPVSDEESDQVHKEIITELLKQVEDGKSKQERAAAAIHVFNYLRFNALKYVQKHIELKNIAIQKAYQIRLEGPDIPELVESVHNLLNALGAPLEPSVPLVDKPISFMATLLKKENIPFNRKVMHLYYKWDAPKKVGCYERMRLFVEANRDALMELTNSIAAKPMVQPIVEPIMEPIVEPMEPMVESVESNDDPRKDLMMSIFEKKNLEFKDDYLRDYYEWEKNAPKLNRYKKMCMFIEQLV